MKLAGSHLSWLESQSIHILREAVAEARNPVMLFSAGKDRAIGPVLEQGLGLRVALAMGLNTDRFGTFSRDVERTGSQLDAARAKIAAGFEYAPYARVGVASEGSFGPHPQIPFLPLGRELVLLIDRERGRLC
ncbi:MAG: hypothetical protein PSX79_16525 [bacterium]|nr:hypothetical protein [bacterium]